MLEGKTILITGATSGIGRAACEAVLGAKAERLIAVGRDEERLGVVQSLDPQRVQTIAFDLTRFTDYRETFASLPPVDGVVFSAGIADSNPLRFFSVEKYQRVVDINQTAPIALTAELARGAKLRNGASLIFISSILGTKIGRNGAAAYAGTKAALTGFAKVIALELANKFIRANCILPGMVNTELADSQTEVSEEARKLDMQRYPLGKRYANVNEVTSVILFLLSAQSSFITGENIVIDGGYCAQ